jgi:hypothetical protein
MSGAVRLSSPACGRGRKILHLVEPSAWILLVRGKAARAGFPSPERRFAPFDLSRFAGEVVDGSPS